MNANRSSEHRLAAAARGASHALLACCLCAASAQARDANKPGVGGNNEQIVVVKGSVVNTADAGAAAKVNVGTLRNARVSGNNKQTVVVGGSIVNTARGRGSKAEVNIGSVGTGGE